MPTVPCPTPSTGRGPSGSSSGASTVALAVRGPPSWSVVVYSIRQPCTPAATPVANVSASSTVQRTRVDLRDTSGTRPSSLLAGDAESNRAPYPLGHARRVGQRECF
jgi:hypothetical protein